MLVCIHVTVMLLQLCSSFLFFGRFPSPAKFTIGKVWDSSLANIRYIGKIWDGRETVKSPTVSDFPDI